jgi:hypothetical protein
MMFKKLKRRSVAFVAVVVLLLVNLAGPASAGYREGRISCQNGWTPFTTSYSGNTSTLHVHYLEAHGTRSGTTTFAVTVWWGNPNYGTWSVRATDLQSGSAGCNQF